MIIDPANRQCNGVPETDWNCCSSDYPCTLGEGDCDSDSDCAGSLSCGTDNCLADFSASGSNWMSQSDCCEGNF